MQKIVLTSRILTDKNSRDNKALNKQNIRRSAVRIFFSRGGWLGCGRDSLSCNSAMNRCKTIFNVIQIVEAFQIVLLKN